MTLFAVVSSLIISVFPDVTANLTVLEFEEIQAHLAIPGATPLSTHAAVSLIHCATFCGADNRCRSFTINKDALSAGLSEVECNVLDSYVSSTADLTNSHLHYVQVAQPGLTLSTGAPSAPTTTTAPPTTTSTTAAPSSTGPPTSTTTTQSPTGAPGSNTIIDIVWGVYNWCSTNSQDDILLLTSNGTVYFYDNFMSMTTTGACTTDSYLSVFKEYSNMPSPNVVKGLLLHQSDIMELYTSARVRRWQSRSDGELLKNSYTANTINTYLGSEAATTLSGSAEFQWTAYRSRNNIEQFFYLGNDQFVLVSDQWGVFSFTKNEDVFDQNGFNMNPWGQIPQMTIALTRITTQNTEFVLVDSYGGVYLYTLQHSSNNNNPTKISTPLGLIVY